MQLPYTSIFVFVAFYLAKSVHLTIFLHGILNRILTTAKIQIVFLYGDGLTLYRKDIARTTGHETKALMCIFAKEDKDCIWSRIRTHTCANSNFSMH